MLVASEPCIVWRNRGCGLSMARYVTVDSVNVRYYCCVRYSAFVQSFQHAAPVLDWTQISCLAWI